MIQYTKLLRGGYRAELGQWSESGQTKKAAETALLNAIAYTPSNTDPAIEIDRRGNIWILWWNGRSWEYARRWSDKTKSCCLVSTKDKREAHKMMLEHIAQWLEVTPEE